FAPLGFRRRAFCPAYGLAEATLAVTGTGPEQEPAVLPEGWVPAGAGARRGEGARVDHRMVAANRMVGSGRALDGVEVSVRDGAELSAPLDADEAERSRAAISRIFRGTEVDLVLVGRGAIPRTSSGKPMRRECWRRYVSGSA